MKSTIAIALAASLPFAFAAPFNLQHQARDLEIDWTTQVTVVTVYATGPPPPAATATATAAPATGSAAFKQVQEDKEEHHSWTWSQTDDATYSAPAPTEDSSSYVAPSDTPAPTPTDVPSTTSDSYTPPASTDVAASTSETAPAATSAAAVPQSYATTGPGPYNIDCGTYNMTADVGAKDGSAGYDLTTGAMQAALLNSTNTWRQQFSAAALEWSYDLQTQAQSTANLCQFEHTNAGQNLAAGYSGPESANDGWAGEYTSYDFSSPGFSEDAGHFTQVVWQGTTHIGCAAVNCGSGQPAQGWYLVCNYLPAGNVIGQFGSQVSPKSS